MNIHTPHHPTDTSRRIETSRIAGDAPRIPTVLDKQAACDHNWERDGQTMTAVRWTCTKCFKTELR